MTATKKGKKAPAVPLEVKAAETMKRWHDVNADETVKAMMTAALESGGGLVYGVLADAIEGTGEIVLAAIVRTLAGPDFAMNIGGAVYVGHPKAYGTPGRPWYTVQYRSERMRSTYGKTESFRTLTDYVSYVVRAMAWEWSKHERKEVKKAATSEAKTMPNPFAVGDVLHWSGGYNMIYNQFLQVVTVGNRTLDVRPIAIQASDQSAGGSERVRGIVGEFTGDAVTVKIVPDIEKGKVTGWAVPVRGRHFTKVDPAKTHYQNTWD